MLFEACGAVLEWRVAWDFKGVVLDGDEGVLLAATVDGESISEGCGAEEQRSDNGRDLHICGCSYIRI